MNTCAKIAAVGALVAAMGLIPASPVAAQTTTATPDLVDQNVKGTVGLGLVGLEIGLLMPGATGLTDPWAWAVFPAIGAAGGVVAGIFVFEQAAASNGRAKASVACLSAGIGLAIPAAISALALAGKRREQEFATLRQRRNLAAARAGSGLVRVSPEGTFIRAPGVSPMLGRVDGRRDRGTLLSLISGRF